MDAYICVFNLVTYVVSLHGGDEEEDEENLEVGGGAQVPRSHPHAPL